MSTVFPHRIRPGDRIQGYDQQVGPVTRVSRRWLVWIVETQSGIDLAFLPFERPRLLNR